MRNALLANVNAVRARLLDGAMDAVVADTGGWGLCEEVCAELALALDDLDPEVVYANPADAAWRACYGGALSGPHWVVRVHQTCIDLTARQFDPTLPYPYLFEAP